MRYWAPCSSSERGRAWKLSFEAGGGGEAEGE